MRNKRLVEDESLYSKARPNWHDPSNKDLEKEDSEKR